ncbi:hypothetical protein KBB76_03725 [Candidatus Saccharibacteria bacterium]|mgnify:CR=1 FL=1|nr:hypothetical protein [Candidatus Saccharibacteria bacterium]HOR23345.1 hypothetical protein [Candidatus Saccharibacteria bacterium]
MSEYQKPQYADEIGSSGSKESLDNPSALRAIEKKAEALLGQSEYTKSTHLGTNDFFVSKDNFCEEIKKEKIFPPFFSSLYFHLDLNEWRLKANNSWQLKMDWMAGNMPYYVNISPDGTYIDSAYNKKPRRFDLALAPKLLGGFVNASADTNNYEIWNQDYLRKAESLTQINPDETLELIEELVCGLADVSGYYFSRTTTPTLIDSFGRALRVQREVGKSDIDGASYATKVSLSQESILGILRYDIEQTRHIDLNDYKTKQTRVTCQTVDAKDVFSLDIDAFLDNLYTFKPIVIDPVSDADSYNKILRSVESSLEEFS